MITLLWCVFFSLYTFTAPIDTTLSSESTLDRSYQIQNPNATLGDLLSGFDCLKLDTPKRKFSFHSTFKVWRSSSDEFPIYLFLFPRLFFFQFVYLFVLCFFYFHFTLFFLFSVSMCILCVFLLNLVDVTLWLWC